MLEVAVIVPIRNVPQSLLDRCLSSIKAQDDTPWEVLVVDNASDQKPVVRIPHHYIRHRRDLGLAHSLNDGFKQSVSKYVCMVAGDDWIEPEWLRIGAGLLDANPWASFVSPNTEHELSWPSILQANYMHAGAMFRRETILNRNGYRQGPFYDWDMWCQLAKSGVRGISVSREFYHWTRDHAQSTSNTISDEEYRMERERIQRENA